MEHRALMRSVCCAVVPETAMGTQIFAQEDRNTDYVKAVYE